MTKDTQAIDTPQISAAVDGKLLRLGWMTLGVNGEPQDDDKPDTQERFCAIVEFANGPPADLGALLGYVWGDQKVRLVPRTRSVAEEPCSDGVNPIPAPTERGVKP